MAIPARARAVAQKAVRAAGDPAATSAVIASWPRWKRITFTGVFAVTIISGALWGASLKMRQEAKAQNKKILEATVDEKVLLLEQRREYLVKQKGELESKISELHARMKARESGLRGRE